MRLRLRTGTQSVIHKHIDIVYTPRYSDAIHSIHKIHISDVLALVPVALGDTRPLLAVQFNLRHD